MPEIWVCTAQPGDAALRSAAAACALELEHAVLSLLLARGRLTRTCLLYTSDAADEL